MSNRRNPWILSVVAILCLTGIAQADFSKNKRAETFKPPATQSVVGGGCGPTDITESGSDTVTSLNSVSCNAGGLHADNSYWRAFLLSDFGITGAFDVCSVRVGIEEAVGAGGDQPITVNLYTSSQAFPGGFPGSLTLIGSATPSVLDQSLTVLDIPVTGTAPAGSQLVVEIFTPNGQIEGNSFFIGSNASPETNPSYLSAADCGVATPTTTGAIGFPNMHIVMHVVGTQTAALTADPTSLTVDETFAVGILNNGVLEMNETPVNVSPGWTNTSAENFTMTGLASAFTGPGDGFPEATYTLIDDTGNYNTINMATEGICFNCYQVSITGPSRAGLPLHSDATMGEDVTPLGIPAVGQAMLISKTWTLHIGESFSDVNNDIAVNPFYPFIETLLHYGVTTGCGGTSYCPGQNNLRQEMAVFLLKQLLGAGYVPPACSGAFADVPCPATPEFPYSNFVEDLLTRGVTTGCQIGPPALFCPADPVTRGQMSVFLLKDLLGSGYVPPACSGVFADVPCPATPEFPYSNFVEDLATRGITAGCQVGPPALFCPDAPVTREQMAAFLSLTFDAVLYGP